METAIASRYPLGNLLSHAAKWLSIGAAFVLGTGDLPAFAQPCKGAAPDGSGSCYLTGTYELREEVVSSLQIINPTGHDLLVYAFFFDSNEHPLRCIYTDMSPNDLWEIVVNRLDPKLDPRSEFGIVKVVSFDKDRRPLIGIVGNQRTAFRGQHTFSETGLHPIQSSLLEEDYSKMLQPLIRECKGVRQ